MSTEPQLGSADEKLSGFFQRVLRLEKEKKAATDAIKDVMAEAKAAGFEPKLLKKAIAMAKKAEREREMENAELEVYLDVLRKTPQPA